MKIITLFGWALLTMSAGIHTLAQSPAKKTTVSANSQTANNITGVWAYVGEVGQGKSDAVKTKIILDKHWMFSQPDPTTMVTLFHHGGTYLLAGNDYAETIEYANETTGGFLGQTFRYEVKVENDTMTLKGIGNPWHEIWKRVK